jgi:L-ascorbate metabolism protein UlaG (beta-lactamase superfamily)
MPNRRRMMQLLGAASAVAAGSWALLGPNRGNAYYRGPVSDHFDGTLFFNPGGVKPKNQWAILKWQLTDRGVAWPESFPSPFEPNRPPPQFDADGTRVTHIGHASFLLQTRGRNILVDPVWAERASPLSFVGPKRANAPGVAFDALPNIDLVLVTHNHYDHMDVDTLGVLWQRYRPRIVTPLGNDTILRQSIPGLEALASDWDATVDLDGGIRVHVEPTLHWSARGATDRRHALWASFVLETGAAKIYCVGDSGYGDGSTFRRVGERHPGLALALLPIGAYEPRWIMRNNHMNPEEALKAFELCGAQRALGHHWGTFRLTNEAVDEPPQRLAAALAAQGVKSQRFIALRPGQVELVS